MIPRTFEKWKNCIINDCKISLTKSFARSRLAVYENRNDSETREFIALYGEAHLNNIIYWLGKT